MKASAVHSVLRHHTVLIALSAIMFSAVATDVARGADIELDSAFSQRNPLILDLSMHCNEQVMELDDIQDFTGRQNIDGLPFRIVGRVRLYGQTPASRQDVYPDSASGIPVNRKFDELHLIHQTGWPDVHGASVAHIHLNYSDGTTFSFPIRYGLHVRDRWNLPSYETERVSDPQTTICWRRPPIKYKAPVRVFKSKIENPLPDKAVETIDVVSAKNLASYYLLAATVVDFEKTESSEFVGDRNFDNKIVIRVVDDTTGKPIKEALIIPAMVVLKQGVVGSPFRTSAAGAGAIPYPTKDTGTIWAEAKMEGYQSKSMRWIAPVPKQYTFRLKPVER